MTIHIKTVAGGRQCWMAHIVGEHEEYVYQREFCTRVKMPVRNSGFAGFEVAEDGTYEISFGSQFTQSFWEFEGQALSAGKQARWQTAGRLASR